MRLWRYSETAILLLVCTVASASPARAAVTATHVSAGSGTTCAVVSSGAVNCWGQNNVGQLGVGVTNGPERCTFNEACSKSPVAVSGLTDAVDVVVGTAPYGCAVRASGTVACWGGNFIGSLGNGSTTNSAIPVDVQGIGDATQVVAGNYQTCALRRSGGVECWGAAGSGDLGNGSDPTTNPNSGPDQCGYAGPCSMTPVPVTGITDAIQISAAARTGCALLASHEIDCWGSGTWFDQGFVRDSSVPSLVSGITNATQVAVGNRGGVCALLADGTVECWKNQLGALTPVPVSGITNATQISASEDHTCVVLADGGVACWGPNDHGQLGDGTTTASDTPVRVAGISNAAQVSAGNGMSCAVLKTGAIECWGSNGTGSLGDGTTIDRPTPVAVGALVAAPTATSPANSTSAPPKPTVGHVGTVGATASVAIGCTGTGSGTACTFTITLRATETIRQGKVIAVSAAKRVRTQHKTVVLGTATATVGAGKSRTIQVRLNAVGRKLLAGRHRLRATLSLTQAGKPVKASQKTVTFTSPPRSPRPHP